MDSPAEKLQRLRRSIYFVPFLGLVPALVTLLRSPSGELGKRSRLSLILGITWLVSCLLTSGISPETSETLRFRLLYGQGLVTTLYILLSSYYLWRASQGKSLPSIVNNHTKKP
ncbi:MAG: hypothetical protein AAGG02_11865 [Cyanobacteria bacterium P01_H01_bin.15]